MKIDLHIHTTFSDGIYTPEKVVEAAISVGLDAIAITDHDNVCAYEIAKKHTKKIADEKGSTPLEIIQGVEINTIYQGYEVHILGYMFDPDNSDFKKMMKEQQMARIDQTRAIVKLLQEKENISIKFDDIKKLVSEGGSIGRPHLAKALTSSGATSNTIEAYNKYINDNSGVYVQRKTVSPFDAVEVIYEAGGLPVFAHPFDVEIASSLIEKLTTFGLRGVEAYHRKHSPAMVEYFSSIAEKFGLIVTGGSDFHSPNPNNGQIIMGKNFVPPWVLSKLVQEKKRLDLAK